MQGPYESRKRAVFLALGFAATVVALGDLGTSELTFTRIGPDRVDAKYSHSGWHGLVPRNEFLIASVAGVEVDPETSEISVFAGQYDERPTHGSGPPESNKLIQEFFESSTAGQTLRIPISRIPAALIFFGICAALFFLAAFLSSRSRHSAIPPVVPITSPPPANQALKSQG